MQKQMNKKGQVVSNSLVGGVLLLVVAAVVAVVGLSMLDGLDDDFAPNSTEANASDSAKEGISNITGKFGLIGTIIVSVFLLTLIVGITLIFRNQR